MSEDLIIELQSRMLGLKRMELARFGEEMKWIKVEEIGEKGRLELIKIIRTVFEEEVLKCNSEQLDSLLGKIQTILDSKTMSQNEESVKAKEKSEQELKQLKTQYEKLLVEQEKLKDQINTVQTQNETTEDITITSESVTQQDKPQSAFLNMKTSMLRREFKIQGQIGEPGHKDKLAYQAVQAGLQLRSYLEGINGLTLPRLRKILRYHFQEKSATELYQLLANISQAPKERSQEFLIRALTIRQKIVFASKESDTKIKYDEGLVQGLFLHALETGLADETIRAKMRPLLKNESVADEELIEVMSSAMAAESERATTFNQVGRVKSSPKVSKIETGVPPRSTESPNAHDSEILVTLKVIQAELNTVQSEVASLRTKVDQKDSPQGHPPSSTFMTGRVGQNRRNDGRQGDYPPMCKKCHEENQVNCPHCFKCGGRNHTARYCRGLGDSSDTEMFASHLSPKKHAAIAKLVGRKCSVRCLVNDVDMEALWDTGAQVSIFPEQVLSDNFSDLKIRDISELLGAGSGLNLTAANGTPIPYKGWVEARFRLNREDEKEVTVPFLVTPEQLEQPIIGYNVIELFLQEGENYSDNLAVAHHIVSSFNNVGVKDAEQLINIIQRNDGELFCQVKTSKRHITIPKKATKTVPCRANTGTIENTRPVLFEPDEKQECPPPRINSS
ncbi:Transposon Ty3-G Gag-Pol poly [Paramuricea clavata]|uniref:Transposon Ty3-G Gag-Pol poly n=1 Tax=Paramuricea clavata TaxID=317549 RepID=A0A6S7FT59_PARCT|nr:Transposon Ty3-G Gag-Pol poly [Paramuricea clavata]